MMSSPDRPISNLEDDFSSNFPNYLPPISPDYVLASPGKTYSKGLLSPMQLSPSTPSQPQALEIGETSWKSVIKRHEEQIQGIQCYLEEIPPERFEQIENGIEGLGKGTIIIQHNFDALAVELQIAELAEVINDMETRHQEDIERLMNSIIERPVTAFNAKCLNPKLGESDHTTVPYWNSWQDAKCNEDIYLARDIYVRSMRDQTFFQVFANGYCVQQSVMIREIRLWLELHPCYFLSKTEAKECVQLSPGGMTIWPDCGAIVKFFFHLSTQSGINFTVVSCSRTHFSNDILLVTFDSRLAHYSASEGLLGVRFGVEDYVGGLMGKGIDVGLGRRMSAGEEGDGDILVSSYLRRSICRHIRHLMTLIFQSDYPETTSRSLFGIQLHLRGFSGDRREFPCQIGVRCALAISSHSVRSLEEFRDRLLIRYRSDRMMWEYYYIMEYGSSGDRVDEVSGKIPNELEALE
ncbi:hypothetical protein Tco_0218426 [Tanacetum coccineum]